MITLRAARFVDCVDVYRWNFAPEVRMQSKTQTAVSLCDHSKWFSRRLRSDDPIWIVQENFHAIGVLRLDRGGDTARISISLAPEARGRNIGRKAIELALAVCRTSGDAVVAEVAVTNTASQKCFEACGFTLADRTTDRFTYRWSA